MLCVIVYVCNIIVSNLRSHTTWEQANTPLLRCHPDRLTIKSNNNTLFSRMPRTCSSDQARVLVGLSGWSAFSGVLICFRITRNSGENVKRRRFCLHATRFAGSPARSGASCLNQVATAKHTNTRIRLPNTRTGVQPNTKRTFVCCRTLPNTTVKPLPNTLGTPNTAPNTRSAEHVFSRTRVQQGPNARSAATSQTLTSGGL